MIGNRRGGPVFLRPRAQLAATLLLGANREALARAAERRIAQAETAADGPVGRPLAARLCRTVWRDAGAIRADSVRISFRRIVGACGVPEHACPKSWRHTFATLLQDANVDPLVRQITA